MKKDIAKYKKLTITIVRKEINISNNKSKRSPSQDRIFEIEIGSSGAENNSPTPIAERNLYGRFRLHSPKAISALNTTSKLDDLDSLNSLLPPGRSKKP